MKNAGPEEYSNLVLEMHEQLKKLLCMINERYNLKKDPKKYK